MLPKPPTLRSGPPRGVHSRVPRTIYFLFYSVGLQFCHLFLSLCVCVSKICALVSLRSPFYRTLSADVPGHVSMSPCSVHERPRAKQRRRWQGNVGGRRNTFGAPVGDSNRGRKARLRIYGHPRRVLKSGVYEANVGKGGSANCESCPRCKRSGAALARPRSMFRYEKLDGSKPLKLPPVF